MKMKQSLLILKLASAVCAAAAVLFAVLGFVLPQGKPLLFCLCALFVLLLGMHVYALRCAKQDTAEEAPIDKAA